MKNCFKRLGIKFTHEKIEGGIKIKIDEGKGYSDFCAEFFFDENGKFLHHALWE